MKRKNNINIDSLFFSKGSDFLEIYLPKQHNASQNTKKSYKYSLTVFRRYVNNVMHIRTINFRFEDCTYDFLLDYRNYLHDDKHLSEKTVNNRIAAIKSYVNYAAARDVSIQQYAFAIHQVPFYDVPKTQQPIIEDITSVATMLSMPPNTKKGLRDKIIMSVLFDTGMRLQELTMLKMRDIDFEDDKILIHIHGKRKKERSDTLCEKTSMLVKQYINEYHPRINPDASFIYTIVKGEQGAMSTRNVQKLIQRYANKAKAMGCKLPDSVSPHTLRRTRGTFLYRDGIPLESIAIKFGHADPKTTKAHYTSPSNDQLREIANRHNNVIPDEEPIWTEDEDEMSIILGF